MSVQRTFAEITRRKIVGALTFGLPALFFPEVCVSQDTSGFPDGYDAVQAAPNSHRVIFENELVRILAVTVPPPGTTEPMHHHRWPSFFLSWDTGGKTPHIRYLRPDGSARDQPSTEKPAQAGRWSVEWMKPEPMHAIQVVSTGDSTLREPPLLRVEIKCLNER